jgi:acetate kinase
VRYDSAVPSVLVVNAGSTSVKLALVAPDEQVTVPETIEEAARDEVAAVGHRVVHGGSRFIQPTVIDDEVKGRIDALSVLAPLQNVATLRAIEEAQQLLPDLPHVAVFDTAFHATLPLEASTYAVPGRWRKNWGIRRYGFHGLSVAWSTSQVPVSRLVVCHLGGGCSITAVRDGRSIDTSMGFSPLEGVPMATRSGTVDPGAIVYLMREEKLTIDEIDQALEHESGLLGMGGATDPRELEHTLALDVYVYRIAAAVGAMAVALGGLDAIVFTAGVGEHSAPVRGAVCRRLAFLGVDLDENANASAEADCDISTPGSPVRVAVVKAREELVIAREVRSLGL